MGSPSLAVIAGLGDALWLEIDLTADFSLTLHRIEDLRGQVKALLARRPAGALNWRPIASGDGTVTASAAGWAAHAAGARRFWMGEVTGRNPARRNPAAGFVVRAVSSAALTHLLDQAGEETRRVFSNLTPGDEENTRVVEDQDKMHPSQTLLLSSLEEVLIP